MSIALSNNEQFFPSNQSVFWLTLMMISGLFLQRAMALNPGSVMIENKSGPIFILDANNPCGEGPEASYVAYEVCNTSGGALTDLNVTISGLSAGFALHGGQAAAQVIGDLGAGECRTVYWHLSFPCVAYQSTNATITVSDNNPGTVAIADQIATSSNLTASAGGLLIGLTPGPPIEEGMPTWFDIEYEFGNIPKNGEAFFQPAGNLDFDAGCMQLTGLEVIASDIPATIPLGASNALYYIAPVAAGGGGHRVIVRFFFDVLCTEFITSLVPFAAATSGNPIKYSSNYSSIDVKVPESFEPIPAGPCAGDPDDFAVQLVGTGIGLENSGDNWGGSWGDYDNDGFPDLFVVSYDENEPNELYHNNGNGTFSKVNAAPFSTDMAASVAATWGDYDNDGDLDLYVGNNIGTANYLYRNEGGGSFTKIIDDPIVSYMGYSHGVSWGDYDNDGFLDLFVATYWETAFNFLYHNNGDGTFTQVTNSPIVNEAAKSLSGVWGDYDNDGFLDLFVANMHDGNNSLYRNLGNGNFQKVTTGAIVNDGGCSVGGSWGDYNNDGYLDLFVANAAGEPNFLYKNNGNGSFTKITTGEIVTDFGHTHGSAWADYDNDGDLDLFVANDGQDNVLYKNNGDETFAKVTNAMTTGGGLSFGSAWADFDNDGDVDLFVANRLSNENFLYENTKGNCNNWMCINLTGTNSNTSGIGAKVFVYATINGRSTVQMREVSSQTGGGTGGQNELVSQFGLGDAQVVDSLVVKWASGYRQVVYNQNVNQCISITEISSSEVCGTVFYDANGNCVKDNGEMAIAGAKVVLQPGDIIAYTNENGEYAAFVDRGMYVIQLIQDSKWSPVCPNAQGTRSVNVTTLGVQFCGNDFGEIALCGLPDLYTEIATTAHRVAAENLMVVDYENRGVGTATETVFNVTLPSEIQMLNSSLPYDSSVGNTFTWLLNDLIPGERGAIYLTYEVLAGTEIGTALQVNAALTANEQDCDKSNDEFTEISMAVAAFDPNDILVQPEGFVTKEEFLEYKIRFQNVGNLPAAQVRVEDVLPTQLDLSTFEMGIVSHTYQLKMEGRKMVWNFPNINLVDSLTNEPESHGFIIFRIKPKMDLAEGDRITNQAAIYFDNLEPVITNQVENILNSTGRKPAIGHSRPLLVFPNPSSGQVVVQSQEMNLEPNTHFIQVQVFDFFMKPVWGRKNLTSKRIDLAMDGLTDGSYTVWAIDNLSRVHVGKVVLHKN